MSKAPQKIAKNKSPKIKKVVLENISQDYYYRYGVAVNEDRSVPSNIDGLKPVARRALWAAYNIGSRPTAKTVKSARIVGEIIGKFHPHGDASAYSTLVTMVNDTQPTFDGQGNWGTFSDPTPAAARYTEARLNKYSMQTFFDPFYLPTITYVPNYDGMDKEPLVLPALLPHLLLNGSFGIGVGVSTNIPSFTKESLIKILKKVLDGEKLTAKLCYKTLVFSTKQGGTPQRDKEQEKLIYENGRGKVAFRSVYVLDEKKKTMVYTAFAPLNGIAKPIEKASEIKDVAKANDITDRKTKGVQVQIDFRKNLSGLPLEKAVEKIDNLFTANENYDIKVTKRYIDESEKPVSKLENSTVIKIIQEWVDYRIALEKTACLHWVGKVDEAIAHLNLMRKAVANRAFLLKALDKKCSIEELENYIAKELKITKEDSQKVLRLPLLKLRALEDAELVKSIKEKESEKKGLQLRSKNAASYISVSLDKLVK